MTSIAQLVMSERPLATGAWAMYDYDEAKAAKFRLIDRFGEPYFLYKSRNGKLFLPRAVCPLGEKDTRIEGHDIDFDLLLPPRNDDQDQLIVEAYEFLQDGLSGIIQAPTGFGKTYCACAITALMRRPTLVVCTKDDLFDQWIEAAKKFLGLKDNQIGRIRADRCDPFGKPFTVGMIHSLAKEGRYPESIRKLFGLVHFDEVQRLPADSFMEVAGMFASKWRVGWSATPDRADGKQVVFHAHIGPVRVISDAVPMIPKVFRYRTTWECPMVPRRNPKTGMTNIVKLPHQAGKIGHVVSHMVKDEERNLLTAKLTYEAWKRGRKIVVFSDQLEHLEALEGRLLSYGVRSRDIGHYVGGISKEQKENAHTKAVLLATYGFMGEGSDVPNRDCAVLTTPRSDVRQIVGRVVRFLEGKPQPIVIDLLDLDSPVFSGYSEKRMDFYRSLGAEVTDVF